jgi:hypothetical protein
MLLLLLVWPEIFFPLVWISLYALLDPLNVRLGNPSLLTGFLHPLVKRQDLHLLA